MKSLSCTEAKKIDLVQYLADIGFTPNQIRGNDYWYCSPFREETIPSFKVKRRFNVWYDHGIQKGGNLIDFGVLFHRCTVAELLQKLEQPNILSFHQPQTQNKTKSILPAAEKAKIVVIDSRENIRLLSLQQYLAFRCIPLNIANRFCREIDFELYGKKHTLIGFQNSAGGYELRSATFKGSSSPKAVTILGKDQDKEILVFEGFMDFLSHQVLLQRKLTMLPKQQPNFLILNSIGFFEKMKNYLDQYPSIQLYFDRDQKGLSVTKEALQISSKYHDASLSYKDHKDLNDFLMNEDLGRQQSKRVRKRL